MTCLMNCVTFLFLGLFLEVVLKLIFSPTTSAPSALEVSHYNALYKFMFTIYHYLRRIGVHILRMMLCL